MLDALAQQEVIRRLEESEPERGNTRQCVENNQILDANPSERLEKRKVMLLSNPSIAAALGEENRNALATHPVKEAPEEAQRAFEKKVGELDTQPCWFLTRGAEVRRSVGRIHIWEQSRRVGWGTGFLVAPNLLVTNQHVLDSLTTARLSRVEFDYEESFTGDILPSALFDLEPDKFFISSPAKGGLDYVLVAVASQARLDSRRPDALLAEFGYNLLIRTEGKLLLGELINAIHHPNGQARQVTIRSNRLMALQELWLHYETDTESGSSGAPLFNNEWQVVGIHHAGAEKRDAAGNILAVGGEIWKSEMGERQKWWYANEGLRISRFMTDVEAQVRAAREQSAPANSEQIVTDVGYTLFESMLKPTTTAPAVPVPVPVVVPSPQVNGTPLVVRPRKRFSPE